MLKHFGGGTGGETGLSRRKDEERSFDTSHLEHRFIRVRRKSRAGRGPSAARAALSRLSERIGAPKENAPSPWRFRHTRPISRKMGSVTRVLETRAHGARGSRTTSLPRRRSDASAARPFARVLWYLRGARPARATRNDVRSGYTRPARATGSTGRRHDGEAQGLPRSRRTDATEDGARGGAEHGGARALLRHRRDRPRGRPAGAAAGSHQRLRGRQGRGRARRLQRAAGGARARSRTSRSAPSSICRS